MGAQTPEGGFAADEPPRPAPHPGAAMAQWTEMHAQLSLEDPANSRPDPQFHAQGKIVGEVELAPDRRVEGTVYTHEVAGATALRTCDVMRPEPCWPMQQDCSR